MKTVACIVSSVVSAYVGILAAVTVGTVMSAASVNQIMWMILPTLGVFAVLAGAFCGSKLSWIPATCYCLPIAVLGGVLPVFSNEWKRLPVSWGSILLVCLCYLAVRKILHKEMLSKAPQPTPSDGRG